MDGEKEKSNDHAIYFKINDEENPIVIDNLSVTEFTKLKRMNDYALKFLKSKNYCEVINKFFRSLDGIQYEIVEVTIQDKNFEQHQER